MINGAEEYATHHIQEKVKEGVSIFPMLEDTKKIVAKLETQLMKVLHCSCRT